MFPPSESAAYASFEAELRARHGDVLFSDDGATIDEVDRPAARRFDDRDRRVLHRRADREAHHGRGRLVPVFGGLVVYSNEAKDDASGVRAA